MEIGDILRKQGKAWTLQETEKIFAWLTSEQLDGLIRFAYGFTKNLEMAEDVTQEGIESAFRYLHTYNPDKYNGKQARPFHNWLYTIVARAARHTLQKQLPQVPLLDELDDRALQYTLDDVEMIKQEQTVMIQRNLKKLAPKYAEGIELCVFQELPLAEAARKSQWPCTEGAMKVRKHRAIQQLQELLTQEGIVQ